MVSLFTIYGCAHGTILDNPVIKEIGLRYHKTAAQTALRWELQQDILPIPKSLNPERMAQNADIFDFNLTQEECLRITGLGETGTMLSLKAVIKDLMVSSL